jgi:hypothetical protein
LAAAANVAMVPVEVNLKNICLSPYSVHPGTVWRL